MENSAGETVCRVVLNGFGAEILAHVLANGGDIMRRTLRDALLLQWTTVEERQPWVSAYRSLLTEDLRAMGAATTEHLALDAALGPPTFDEDGARV